MKSRLIAVVALAMAPALAMAQAAGGQAGGQAGGTGGGQQGGGGAGGAAGGAAGLVPSTREQQRQDSIIGAKRAQQGDTLTQIGGTARTAGQDTGRAGQQGQVTTESHGEIQSDTSNRRSTTGMQDTTLGGNKGAAVTQQDTSAKSSSDTVKGAAEGRLATGKRGHMRAHGKMSLTSDQVKQLQQALNDNGCNVGTPDGVMGPKTRQGIQCIKKQKNISGNNMSDVYKALNLNFSTTGTAGASDTTSMSTSSGEVSSDSSHVRANKRQTSGANRGGIRPKADTSHTDSTTTSQTGAGAAQRGKGMHDSSTSQTGASRDSTKPPR